MSVELAMYVRRCYGIAGVPSTDELIRVLEGEGASYDGEAPLRGRIRGLVFRGHVVTQSGIEPEERRAAIAHELAHVLLDHDNELHLLTSNQSILFHREERRANLLAGWIIFGDLDATDLDATDLASHAELPLAFVCRWLEMLEGLCPKCRAS